MEFFDVKVLKVEVLTHDTNLFRVEKPGGFTHKIGQAVWIALSSAPDALKRPYTLASLPSDSFIDFIIKSYSEREGLSRETHKLVVGNNIFISKAFGPDLLSVIGDSSVFVAAGCGITKFLALLRTLKNSNSIDNYYLFYSNKTKSDVVLEDFLRELFSSCPNNLVLTLTRESNEGFFNGRIDKEFFINHLPSGVNGKKLFVCGPSEFSKAVSDAFNELSAE